MNFTTFNYPFPNYNLGRAEKQKDLLSLHTRNVEFTLFCSLCKSLTTFNEKENTKIPAILVNTGFFSCRQTGQNWLIFNIICLTQFYLE